MPVTETLELTGASDTETVVDVASVVANRVLPELFTRGDEEVFRGPREPATGGGAGRGRGRTSSRCWTARSWPCACAAPGRAPGGLRSGLPAGVELVYVPELFQRTHGVRATRQIAEALGAELRGS